MINQAMHLEVNAWDVPLVFVLRFDGVGVFANVDKLVVLAVLPRLYSQVQ
jgi:hypothetical protein